MAKFPSQRKIVYQTGNISDDNFTTLASGGVSGDLNLPKDLSLLNRRGYASTTRKGVPLVYQCKVDLYVHDELGNSPHTHADDSKNTLGTDAQVILKLAGCQNNWVMRNAAVKWHAARENMFTHAGIKKSDRGAYAHEIRYNYDGNADTWMVPIDADGAAFTGGTWDASELTYSGDDGFSLKLVGQSDDEETDAFAGSVLQIGHSYLLSRSNQEADTNLQSSEGPAKFSVLKTMIGDPTSAVLKTEDMTENARNEQDNPPYEVLDISDSGDVNHDITEPVELGRAIAGMGNAYGSMIVDIPFGLGQFTATVAQTASIDDLQALICVEVLDIYEMQG
jgi:hypothetical protein